MMNIIDFVKEFDFIKGRKKAQESGGCESPGGRGAAP